jgi:hypothetical protein
MNYELRIQHRIIHWQNNPANKVKPKSYRSAKEHQHKKDAEKVGVHIEIVAQATTDAGDFGIVFASH